MTYPPPSAPKSVAPMYWEDAAYGVVDEYTMTFPHFGMDSSRDIESIFENHVTANPGGRSNLAVNALAVMLDAIQGHRDDNEAPPEYLQMVGGAEALRACYRKHFFEMMYLVEQVDSAPANNYDVVETIIGKQRDYGHDNINAYGIAGVEVRMSDKIARLRNLKSNNTPPANESLMDTLVDLVGYSIVEVGS